MNDYWEQNKVSKYQIKNNNNIINSSNEFEFDEYDYNKQNKAINNEEDDRLMYVLLTLGLGDLIHIFNENNISFIDLLLLSKESLKDLGLEMYQRNRIFTFSTCFNKSAKEYSIREISEFFDSNKQFLFNTSIYNKLIKSKKNLNIKANKSNRMHKFKNENIYFNDDENVNDNRNNYYREYKRNNPSSGRVRNRKKNIIVSSSKSYKADKIIRKYLLIKKGVDEFLSKLNRQKDETEHLSNKFNIIVKRIYNQNYNNNFSNNINYFQTYDDNYYKFPNSYSSRKMHNIYNIDNENDIDFPIENKKETDKIDKNEEYKILIEKVNELEKMKIDDNLIEHLNQIKNYINEKGENLMIDEIFSLQKETHKIIEIINKKDKLKTNLEKYNKKIEQRKQLIYELENEK